MLSQKDWLVNLVNAASIVTQRYGTATLSHFLSKYGAKTLEQVNPCDYPELFDDLDYMANDA